MVISQIAGLATAFGTGELSGAGFGPNYTILMKLGYEFFAPRILEEMEKNPNVFFQDTLWFQKFQKQIKLYSDKVMKETLDTLLTIPQETIDSIQNKFQESLETGAGFTGIQGLNDLVKVFTLFMQATQATNLILANAVQFAAASGGHGGTGTLPDQPFVPGDLPEDSPGLIKDEPHDQPPPPELTQEQLYDKYPNDYNLYRQKGGLLSKEQYASKGLSNTEVRKYLQNLHPVPTAATTGVAKNSRRGGQSVALEVQNKQTQITARTHLINQYFDQQGNTIPPPKYVIGLWTSRNEMILSLFNLWWIYQGYDAPHV